MKAFLERLKQPVALSSISSLWKKKSVLGIDVGAWSTKIVQMKPGENGFQFGRFLQVPQTVVDAGAGLKKFIDEQKMGRARAAFAIADEKVESHDFRLPKLEKKELETAIAWELKKTIASPEFVFHDVLAYENEEGVQLQCVVAAKDIVEGRFEEGKRMGVTPEFLETESSALCACVRFVQADRVPDKVAVIDLGYTSFRLIFIHQGRVSFTRSLYFGLSSVCQQAASQLGVTAEELLELLPQQGKGEGPALMAGLERYVQESLYTLCEEFRRSEFFARDQKGLEDIDEILLCGGGACMPPAMEYLRHHLPEKKIETLNPLKGRAGVPAGIPEDTGPLWACAVGLAVRDIT